MSELFIAARALVAGEERREVAFLVEKGRFSKIGDAKTLAIEAARRGTKTRRFPEDRLLVPGFINGHSHAYQVLLRGWADDWSFDKWRSDAL